MSHAGPRTVWILSLVSLFTDMASEMLYPVMPIYLRDIGFSVLLIGKDGGEKLRVNEVPDLQAIYAVVDAMPMRSREMTANPSRC